MGDTAIFKIFLNLNDTVEVKKFSIEGDTSVITNFYFMREKLQMIFPRLRECEFKITWRDSDGDDITIENDEDLIFALTEMEDPVKVLYVTVLSSGRAFSHPRPPSSNVVCDICNKTITSYRYKCLQCYDYDLCAECEHAGHHSQHMILRTSTPELPFTRCGRKIFEQVNKAVRKANHVAYKECKKRWPKGDRRKSEQQQSDKANAGESSARESRQHEQSSQSCPFQDYIPNIFPIIDAFANAATSTANVAANAASSAAQAAASAATGQQEPTAQTKSASAPQGATEEQNAAAQFMEAIRSVINSFAVPPQQTQHSEPKQPQQETQQTPTAPTQVNIDLTATTPDEPMDVSGAQREPGWTLLSSEDTQQQFQSPLLTPTVVPMPQPVIPPVVQPQVQQPVQPTQPPQSNPIYPVLTQHNYFLRDLQDPKIAAGFQKLLEMGFNDEALLITLLKKYDGNVDQVVRHIFESK